MYSHLYLKTNSIDEFAIDESIDNLKFLGIEYGLTFANTYQNLPALNGQMLQDTKVDKTDLTANFWLQFSDYNDFLLAKHAFNKYFVTNELIRLRTSNEPYLVYYVLPTNFEIKPTQPGSHTALISVKFENPSGCRYSLYRSDQVNNYDEFGMNLPANEELKYVLRVNNNDKFTIKNLSDMAIKPFEQHHDLKIIINFSGNSLKLTNTTNNSEWQYNQHSDGNDTIVLNGVKTTCNNQPASINTDYGYIDLNVGDNNIQVSGCDNATITFSFPFIYA